MDQDRFRGLSRTRQEVQAGGGVRALVSFSVLVTQRAIAREERLVGWDLWDL